jgi:hypothetical protein
MRNNQKGSALMGFAIIGILGFMFYIACYSDLAKMSQEAQAPKVYFKSDQQLASEIKVKPKKRSALR